MILAKGRRMGCAEARLQSLSREESRRTHAEMDARNAGRSSRIKTKWRGLMNDITKSGWKLLIDIQKVASTYRPLLQIY